MFTGVTVTVLALSAFVSASFSGDGTYYAAGLGACGITNTDTDMIAAISAAYFDSYPGATNNPNENPICGKQIRATYGTASVVVAITDRCAGCAGQYDIDFTPSAFTQIADESLGRVEITWEFVDSSDSSSSTTAETTAAETTAAETTAAETTAEATTAYPTEMSSETNEGPAYNVAVDSSSADAATSYRDTAYTTSTATSTKASKTCDRASRRRRNRRSHRAARHIARDGAH